MSSREQSLAERRLELVQRSAAQRAALIANADPIVRKAAALDRIVIKLRQYPMVTAAAGAAIAFFGSRKLFALATRAITLYALFKR
ncbi:MAG TPA: YqjK family protein [Burkholderiales bacterium]|nr:YqjK family protein [Burkholderiales bacterium]